MQGCHAVTFTPQSWHVGMWHAYSRLSLKLHPLQFLGHLAEGPQMRPASHKQVVEVSGPATALAGMHSILLVTPLATSSHRKPYKNR